MNQEQYSSLQDLYHVANDLNEIQVDAITEVVTTMEIMADEGKDNPILRFSGAPPYGATPFSTDI